MHTVGTLPYLDEHEISRLLPPQRARDSQRAAFEALSDGTAVLPPRLLLPGAKDSTAFCYAARLSADGPAISKFGSVNPHNPDAGMPAIHAVVTILDASTGEPTALLDGTSLTAIRTAAASALAVDTLANKTSASLALIGTGAQARWHLKALLHLRPWDSITVTGINDADAQRFAGDMAPHCAAADQPAPRPASIAEAVQQEVIVLCTTSSTPVIDAESVQPGATVVGIGSFAPDRREVPAELLARAVATVDDVEACSSDSGAVIDGLDRGLFTRDHLIALGDVLTGRAAGRTDDDDIVVHTSIGLGVQDAAAADYIFAAMKTPTP